MKGKRILICCNRILNTGGIEKTLCNLLSRFDTKENDILLVINKAGGVYYKQLPTEEIEIFYTSTVDARKYLMDDFKHLRIGHVICGLWNRLMLRLERDWYARIVYTYRIHKRGLQFPGHFDCAIAFSNDYSDLSMILEADADKRVAFVHGDATFHTRPAKFNDKLIRRLDMIYSVSHEAGEKFMLVHPKYIGRMDVFHNVFLIDDILQKAEAAPTDMILDGIFNLCTVARVSSEKGQYMIPQIAARLLKDGFQFRWYIVGSGSDLSRVEQEVLDCDVQSHVILLGNRENPYPYMKNCDLYVHTSFHEAYSTAVAEARILNKPIVATDACGNREQFNGGDGIIVAQTPEAIYQGVRKLMEDDALRRSFSQKLKQSSVYVDDDWHKLYQYIME